MGRILDTHRVMNTVLDKPTASRLPRHTAGAVPLRFLEKTAITVVTPSSFS